MISTEDNAKGLKENMKLNIDYVYSCGPQSHSDINSGSWIWSRGQKSLQKARLLQ